MLGSPFPKSRGWMSSVRASRMFSTPWRPKELACARNYYIMLPCLEHWLLQRWFKGWEWIPSGALSGAPCKSAKGNWPGELRACFALPSEGQMWRSLLSLSLSLFGFISCYIWILMWGSNKNQQSFRNIWVSLFWVFLVAALWAIEGTKM